MRSKQPKSRQKMTSGLLSRRFLEKLQIGKGDLVSYGWYYRSQPIESCPPIVLGIVLENPVYSDFCFEKIRKKGGENPTWYAEDVEDLTLIALVLNSEGETCYYPLDNLIKREIS